MLLEIFAVDENPRIHFLPFNFPFLLPWKYLQDILPSFQLPFPPTVEIFTGYTSFLSTSLSSYRGNIYRICFLPFNFQFLLP
jgi:hypothetical protein